MYSIIKKVEASEDYDQLLESVTKDTQELQAINKIKMQEASYYGYLKAPSFLSSADIASAIRYGNDKDKLFKQLSEWFELDFIRFDSAKKQIMCWGEKKNIEETFEAMEELLSSKLKYVQERNETEAKRMLELKNNGIEVSIYDRDFIPSKHT
jgi:hypothetical protein